MEYRRKVMGAERMSESQRSHSSIVRGVTSNIQTPPLAEEEAPFQNT
jgi:hypothetical protein